MAEENVNGQILVELREMNRLLAESAKSSEAADWKLWIIMNGLCDALLTQGILIDDPRKTEEK